jgi:hypothetical protein
MAVIDLGSRTPQEPGVWPCRRGRDTLWLYATGAADCASGAEEPHTMQGFRHIRDKRAPRIRLAP